MRGVLRLIPLLALFLLVALVHHPSDTGSDEHGYLFFAERISSGGYALEDPRQPELFLWRGPGLPVLLAPFVALDAPIGVMRLTCGPLALFGACVALFFALRYRLTERQALVGAYGLGLFLPLWKSLGYVSSEPVSVMLVCLALLGWAAFTHTGRWSALIGCGIALGALTLVRLEYTYVLGVGVLLGATWWLLRRTHAARGVVVASVVGLAMLGPWLAYTHSQTDRFPYLTNAGALSLYWMASPVAEERGNPHGYDAVFTDEAYAAHRPLFRRLETMPPVEQNSELGRIAKANIQAHPLLYARNVVFNATRMAFNWPFSYKPPNPFSILFYSLFNLALLGSVALGVRRRRTARGFWSLAGPPLAFATLGFLEHLPVAGYPRYWIPVVPAFVFFAALVRAPPPAMRRTNLAAKATVTRPADNQIWGRSRPTLP